MFKPQFKVSPRVYVLLDQIALAREHIRSSLIQVTWVPLLVKDAMARLAWGSTAIEGSTLSLEAVKNLADGQKITGYPDQHVQMASNYLKALTWIQQKHLHDPFLEKDLFHLHILIAKNAADEGPFGAYRKVDVRAGLHVGLPWRQVPSLTRHLLTWFNTSAFDVPAVFSSALFHLRFAEIHPFRDGNGRMARLLATWDLYRKGFDTLHVFALDEVLLENRAFYIKALQRVQVEKEDLGTWIEFIAEALLETLERVKQRLSSFGRHVTNPVSLTLRQEKLLQTLRERGPLNIQEIARALRLTAPGAHYALKPLLSHHLVAKVGAHKKTKYKLPNL